MKINILLGIALLLFAVVIWSADAVDDHALEEARSKLATIIQRDALLNEQKLDAGAFTIDSYRFRELGADFRPTASEHDALRIKAKSGSSFVALVDRGPQALSFGVSTSKEVAVVQVRQRHSETRPSQLVYTVLDDEGRPKLDVYDYEMDGQADTRMHYGPSGGVELWYVDRWYRMERQEQQRFITVEGKRKAVVNQKGQLAVVP